MISNKNHIISNILYLIFNNLQKMNTNLNQLNKKTIFYIIFFLIFFSILFYISWLVSLLSSILTLIVYSFIAYSFYFLWKKLRKKEKLDYISFLNYFLYKVSICVFISIILISSFSYYKNEINPAKMPTFTISNWEKEIIFQAMSHIWSKNFYEQIKEDLTSAKKQWYVYYYEWVKDWTTKNKEDFNKAIWVKFDSNLYENFSKLYWVTHQDNSIYYNLINNLDYNVDLSIDEIMENYNKLEKTQNSENSNNFLQNEEVVDANTEIIKTLASLNNKELEILRYINKALLNFIIASDETQDIVLNNFSNKNLFKIILDKRNEVLSDKIINSEHKKIYITYWLLHFEWVLKILQENDINWKITKTTNLYPIK